MYVFSKTITFTKFLQKRVRENSRYFHTACEEPREIQFLRHFHEKKNRESVIGVI